MSAASQNNETESSIFIKEVSGHQERFKKLLEFTHSATRSAGIMLLAAVAAIIIANSGAYEAFAHFIHQPVGFVFGDYVASMSIGHVINDILMAIFFLLVGLEIKYEMTVGELTNIRQALLPIVAACGGVVMPIVIYLAFNGANPETAHGWGVPTATDIAFALGILALLGSRIPNGVRVFLSTLAVADDIIAILVIALFYGETPDFMWLGASAAVLVVLIVMNRSHVYSLFPYIGVGIVLWFCVFMSGIHSTIAGVLLAFTIPSGSRVDLKSFTAWSGKKIRQADEAFQPDQPIMGQKDYMRNVSNLSAVARQVIPPATRLEHKLYPWVYFAILPLFALTNADVSLMGVGVADLMASPILPGVFFGLLVGKPLGIMLFSFIVVKTGLASLPENVNWKHMLGAAILGGVGFTMAIFVANLAFPTELEVTTAKAAILAASTLAGLLGFLFLFMEAKADAKRGVVYVSASAPDANIQHARAEAQQASGQLVEDFDEESLQEYEEAQCGDRPKEVVARIKQDADED